MLRTKLPPNFAQPKENAYDKGLLDGWREKVGYIKRRFAAAPSSLLKVKRQEKTI